MVVATLSLCIVRSPNPLQSWAGGFRSSAAEKLPAAHGAVHDAVGHALVAAAGRTVVVRNPWPPLVVPRHASTTTTAAVALRPQLSASPSPASSRAVEQ